MLNGGCYCGAIRYQIDGTPFHESNCHCSICRRTTGAPFVTWFSVRRGEFRFVSGKPARFKSSERGTRSFCPRCGGQLTFENSDFPEEICRRKIEMSSGAQSRDDTPVDKGDQRGRGSSPKPECRTASALRIGVDLPIPQKPTLATGAGGRRGGNCVT